MKPYWWEKDVRRLFHGVSGASPWNEERMTDTAIEVMAGLFKKAENLHKTKPRQKGLNLDKAFMETMEKELGVSFVDVTTTL